MRAVVRARSTQLTADTWSTMMTSYCLSRQLSHAMYSAHSVQRTYAHSAWPRPSTARGNQPPATLTAKGPPTVSSKQRRGSW